MSNATIVVDINWDIDAKIAALRSHCPDHHIVSADALTDGDRETARYAVVWSPRPGLLASLPNLEAIFSLGAGVDHVVNQPDLPDVPLVRFVDPDLTGRMTEWVVLQCLMHLRGQRLYDAQQRARLWREVDRPVASSVTVGILGFGELGQASAKALLALGFNVRAWSRTPKVAEKIDTFSGESQFNAFLSGTDILISLLPHTGETESLIGAGVFEKLRRDGPFGKPVFINGGRGKVHVEADIIEALESGMLGGVSLDVFEREPLAENSPLWGLDNAILTPHMAAVSDSNALATYIANQIARHEAGQELQNVVDRDRGY